MEGLHLLQVLLDARLYPREVYYEPGLMQRTAEGAQLLQRLLRSSSLLRNRLFEVSERVMEVLSDAQSSQGVVCVLAHTDIAARDIRAHRAQDVARPALLVLDDLADPGNMGTILRTALAADVAGVLLTGNCVDYLSPKVVRAAAGAHIALPVEAELPWSTIEQRISEHCGAEPCVLLAEAGSSHLYYAQDFTRPFVLIIGNEAHGPSAEARSLATLSVTIPLANHVESLNAAMASGIILYEAMRQRRSQG
jgi:TrmH family RNA methyltransferase